VLDPNAPLPVLTKEEQDMVDMDRYYTNYNHELPDQKPMALPVKIRKSKSSSINNLQTHKEAVEPNEKALDAEKELAKGKKGPSNAPEVSFAAGAILEIGETPPKSEPQKMINSKSGLLPDSFSDQKQNAMANSTDPAAGASMGI
jgi:hypothetical protein